MEHDEIRIDINEGMEREDDLLEDFTREVEAALDDLELDVQTVPEAVSETLIPGEAEGDAGYEQMLDTFMEIMRTALRPVTRYVKAIKIGFENKDVFEVIWLTTAPLLEKVQQVGLVEPAAKLEDFVAATEKIIHAREVLQRMRVEFFMTYAVLQDTFKLEYRGNKLAIKNIIDFYRMIREDEDVDEDDLSRFFAIGIPSLTWVRKTPIGEIQSLSGMSPRSIKRMKYIIRHFRREKEAFESRKRREEQAIAKLQGIALQA